MDNQIKLFTILFLVQISAAAIAANCEATDTNCILKEKQLTAIKESDVQPTKITMGTAESKAAKGSSNNTVTLPFPMSQTKPYVYGVTDTGTPPNGDKNSQDAGSKQNTPNPILNLFTPKQQAENNQGSNNNKDDTTQSGIMIYR